MTTVERFDDNTATWTEITDYASQKITNGVSDVHVAPTAQLQLPRTSPVSSGTRIRITEPSGVVFEGTVVRTKPRSQSAMRVDAEHDAYGLFEENITLSVSGTDEDVLQAALDAAGGTWTLAYPNTPTSLANPYEVEGRSVKRVFRDMTDRVGRVWWVDVDHTIHVEPLGYRGTFASVDTSQDAATVTEYTPDDVDTVVNDVTVVGTGGEKVTGGDEDSASISEYVRQPERTNVSYITTQSEADAYASALLNPEPDSSATARLGASVGNVAAPLPNYTLDVTDEQGVGLNEELVIEKQVVTQGSAEVELGEGAGVNIAKFNRREKSKEDVTEPGSVYNSDRIADGAIQQEKLVDGSVIESKLDDLAVTLNKVDFDAIDETKIQDGAVRTPQLFAGAVTAEKLNTDFARANRLLAGEIEALDIATDTLTANEIDTLDLDAGELSVTDASGNGVSFEIDSGTGILSVTPIGTAILGSGSNNWSTAFFDDAFINRLGMNSATTPSEAGAAFFSPSGGIVDIQIGSDGGQTNIRPNVDGSATVGTSQYQFEAMHAQEYISGGTTISDGGDVLAGVADAAGGLPDHLYADDGEGGVRVGAAAEWVTRVTRAQQEKIESLEAENTDLRERVSDLEARLSALETQADPNA